jgi:hypothetical protein
MSLPLKAPHDFRKRIKSTFLIVDDASADYQNDERNFSLSG